MAEWSLSLPVAPVPKARPRLGRGHVYTPQVTAQYETTVAWLLRQQHVPCLDGDLGVDVTFWIARAGGDIDNYVKALFDGVNQAGRNARFPAGWNDDRQVTELHARLLRPAAGLTPHIDMRAWQLDAATPPAA